MLEAERSLLAVTALAADNVFLSRARIDKDPSADEATGV